MKAGGACGGDFEVEGGVVSWCEGDVACCCSGGDACSASFDAGVDRRSRRVESRKRASESGGEADARDRKTD